ncbi:MAG: HAD-IA family hydrolase [Pelomonas sp.]|nr:HAD-IA family hydrolase [Roseateles sp.]
MAVRKPVWLFDLDNTLYDARAVFTAVAAAMTDYIAAHVGVERDAAEALRRDYWKRYGATLPGLTRHHGVDAADFNARTHALPQLATLLRAHARDLAALRRLPGRKFVLTNGPQAYAQRVLAGLGLRVGRQGDIEGVIALEQMRMFGEDRPKPDARMLRHVCARRRLRPRDCVLVEDALVHQKSARRVGMKTVWMQGWLHGDGRPEPEAAAALRRRPAFVNLRVRRLAGLERLI